MLTSKKRLKKGQMTAFMLLGILIVLIFAFLYSMTSSTKQQDIEQKAQEIVADIKTKQAVDYYVTLCVKKATEDGLMLLGRQGGRIYKQQGGLYPDNTPSLPLVKELDPFVNKSFNTSFGILKPVLGSTLFPDVPAYPFIGFLGSKPLGFYGINSLPYLCDPNGPNRREMANTTISGVLIIPCEAAQYSPARFPSIQTDLRAYIENKTQECVNLSLIREYSGYEIQPATPNISVIFTDNEVNTIASFPLKIAIGTKEATKSLDFQIAVPVRIKKIHSVMRDFVENERQNLFHVSIAYQLPYVNMSVSKFCPYCGTDVKFLDDSSNDIFRLVDDKSLINVKPYIFQFAIENRIPALEWIHEISTDIFGTNADIIAFAGEEILIEPIGYDADEDIGLVYNYSGWRETQDEHFNFTCYDLIADFSACVIVDKTIQGHNWTNSGRFLATNRTANITTTSADIGLHNLTINVTDQGGKMDYQIVRILVLDKPRAIPQVYNTYDDINDSYASPEDVYVYNASASTSFLVIQNFEWNTTDISPTGTGNKFTSFGNLIFLPDLETDTTINIGNIKERHNFTYPSQITGKTNVTLKVTAYTDPTDPTSPTLSDVGEVTFNVVDCLPHRNAASPAYPYNTTDPFYSDHSCCLGSGTDPYASGTFDSNWGKINTNPNFACFGPLIEYGANASFGALGSELNTPTISYKDISGDPVSGTEHINDIFNRTYTATCGNSRGNACLGNADDLRQVQVECSDFNTNQYGAPQTERCEAPCASLTDCTESDATTISTVPTECAKYGPGQTFENDFLGTGTGICGQTPACSDKYDSTSYYAGGTFDLSGTYPFSCQGFCDGDGSCTLPDNCVCSSACGASATCNNQLPGFKDGLGGCCKQDCQVDEKVKSLSTPVIDWSECSLSSKIDQNEFCYDDNDNFCYYTTDNIEYKNPCTESSDGWNFLSAECRDSGDTDVEKCYFSEGCTKDGCQTQIGYGPGNILWNQCKTSERNVAGDGSAYCVYQEPNGEETCYTENSADACEADNDGWDLEEYSCVSYYAFANRNFKKDGTEKCNDDVVYWDAPWYYSLNKYCYIGEKCSGEGYFSPLEFQCDSSYNCYFNTPIVSTCPSPTINGVQTSDCFMMGSQDRGVITAAGECCYGTNMCKGSASSATCIASSAAPTCETGKSLKCTNAGWTCCSQVPGDQTGWKCG